MSTPEEDVRQAVEAAVTHDMSSDELEEELWTTAQDEGRDAVGEIVEEAGGFHVKTMGDTDYYSLPWEKSEQTLVVQVTDDDAWYEPFEEWIYDSWTWDGLGKFLDHEVSEGFVEEFWRTESTVYHATGYDEAARIVSSGELQARDSTRGINNQSVGRAVFATRSAPLSIYGDVHFTIDVDAMADDGFKPHVEMEPGILEARQRETIAAEFYVDDFWADPPQDEDPDTVIIHDDIPLEYLGLADETDVEALIENAERMRERDDTYPEEWVSGLREWARGQ